MPAIIARAPAKTILFGEHAVVYGYPAIAIPVDSLEVRASVLPCINNENTTISFHNKNSIKQTYLGEIESNHPIQICIQELGEKIGRALPAMKITISSNIPIAAGLGSSAAIAVAVTRAVSEFLGLDLSNEEINQIAYISEKAQHGTPSGIDNTVIAYNQPVLFRKGKPIQSITIRSPFHIILADSGDRELTKDVVADVRKHRENNFETVNACFEQIGGLTEKAIAAVQNGNARLIGALMNENHKMLQQLTVSSKKLDALVSEAVISGAYGAKLCGAGRGGFMVAVSDKNIIDDLKKNLLEKGATRVFSTVVGPKVKVN